VANGIHLGCPLFLPVHTVNSVQTLKDLTDFSSPYGSVHIRDKTTVSERLAAAGLAAVYNHSASYWQGPIAQHASASGSALTVTFGNTGAAGLLVNKTAGCKPPFEFCTLGAGANCSQALSSASGGVGIGNWSAATIASSTATTVTLALSTEYVNSVGGPNGGKMLVRYAWAAVPFEYKQAAVYAKEEAFPAGPFVLIVQ
jgi:hypothetical protein